MISQVLLLACLAAAPVEGSATSSDKVKLLVMELVPAGGISAEVATAMTDVLTHEVASRGFFDVLSTKDVQAILGSERQRQMTGCSEESTECMTEVAGALGARFVLNGTLVQLGDAFQITLQTLDTRKAQPIGRSNRIARDLATLREQLPFAVADATATPRPAPPSRVLPWSLIAGGGLLAITGGFAGFDSITREASLSRELREGEQNPEALRSLDFYRAERATIAQERLIGGSLLLAGAALVGLGLWLMPEAVDGGAVALVPARSGAALVGVFP